MVWFRRFIRSRRFQTVRRGELLAAMLVRPAPAAGRASGARRGTPPSDPCGRRGRGTSPASPDALTFPSESSVTTATAGERGARRTSTQRRFPRGGRRAGAARGRASRLPATATARAPPGRCRTRSRRARGSRRTPVARTERVGRRLEVRAPSSACSSSWQLPCSSASPATTPKPKMKHDGAPRATAAAREAVRRVVSAVSTVSTRTETVTSRNRPHGFARFGFTVCPV